MNDKSKNTTKLNNALLTTRDKFISFKTNEEVKSEINNKNKTHIYDKKLLEKKRKLLKVKGINIEQKKDEEVIKNTRKTVEDKIKDIEKSQKEIIENALINIRQTLNCQVAAIFLFSKDGTLKRVGLDGLDKDGNLIENEWFKEENYAVGESIIGKAAEPSEKMENGEVKYGITQINNDLEQTSPKYQDEYLNKLGKLSSIIAVPLNGKNKTYGVLRVINKIDSNANITDFFDSDYAAIFFLAGVISCRISNFRRDTQGDFLRDIKNSLIKSERITFNYLNCYQETLDFLISFQTAFKVAILRVKNDDTGAMEVKYFAHEDGVTKKENDDPRKLKEGFVGIASDSLEAVIIPKITANGMLDEFINADWVKENGFESFGCFPLIIPETEEVVGTISLFAGYEYEFHAGTIKFLNDVTSSIATLIGKEKKKQKIKKRFDALVEDWIEETGFLSSTTKMVNHPAYQQIIGMGETVIPLLLKELEKRSGRWFSALSKITGENPVFKEHRGVTQEMIYAWLDWGRKKGYID